METGAVSIYSLQVWNQNQGIFESEVYVLENISCLHRGTGGFQAMGIPPTSAFWGSRIADGDLLEIFEGVFR